MSIGGILCLTSEIAVMVFDCCSEFQNGNGDITFAVVHQFLNCADTISQNETSVIDPGDLLWGEKGKKNENALFSKCENFRYLFVNVLVIFFLFHCFDIWKIDEFCNEFFRL